MKLWWNMEVGLNCHFVHKFQTRKVESFFPPCHCSSVQFDSSWTPLIEGWVDFSTQDANGIDAYIVPWVKLWARLASLQPTSRIQWVKARNGSDNFYRLNDRNVNVWIWRAEVWRPGCYLWPLNYISISVSMLLSQSIWFLMVHQRLCYVNLFGVEALVNSIPQGIFGLRCVYIITPFRGRAADSH